ncbi:electron transfer flavoprotein subunit YdiR [Leminorella grimontii]|uniref:hypothetical protein n=1 Tax=Leminorella grimontii TaxID=82981 RepID=UPI0010B98DD1|nr:hypothetical protein [Leminorella grimontii]VFS62155.1 electron transfer flavoprotein subunit YdiR [Leminorella grimontii]
MANLLPTVFVYADKAERLAELIALARQWGEKVNVLFVGGDADVSACVNLGADRVYHLPQREETVVEDYVPSFAQIIKESGSRALVLLASSKRGKAIAAPAGGEA